MVLLEVVRVLYSESRVEVVMFCKTHRDFLAEGDEASMAKRYRKDIKQVFLENKLSGPSALALIISSTKAGAKGVEDFAGAGNCGKKTGNIARDLMRKMMKGSKWPLC